MFSLQAGQEQLHLLTTDTVRKLYESQNELISHQLTIRQSQDNVINNIHNSMEELTKEKAMIATGNTELAKLTQNIREKLGRYQIYSFDSYRKYRTGQTYTEY